MSFDLLVGVAFIIAASAIACCVIIQFYFSQKEEYVDRLRNKIKDELNA